MIDSKVKNISEIVLFYEYNKSITIKHPNENLVGQNLSWCDTFNFKRFNGEVILKNKEAL